MKRVYRLLTELSSNRIISKTTGRLAKSKLSKRWIPHFAKVYKVNVDEAEKNLQDYPTLNAFFTRRIKTSCRPIDPREERVISPVDGTVTGLGRIEEGTLLHVKGQTYTLREMLEDARMEARFRNGQFIVLYLSPTDYHRIHSPISGKISHHRRHRGKVYPVNAFGLQHGKRVLSRNERLITYVKNDDTHIALVKVGALNVASIRWSDRLTFPDVQKGDELAYFEFGSSVVLLFEADTFTFNKDLQVGDKLKMGQALGQVVQRSVQV